MANATDFVHAGQWRDYVRTLYGENGDYAVFPQFEDVEVIYDQLLGAITVDMRDDSHCPRKMHVPFLLRAPHSPLIPWLKREIPSLPTPSFTWVEVTHCAGSRHERAGAWFYAACGSALFINIGRTRSFHSHADAVRHYLGVAGCTDGTCNAELPRIARRARAAGLDSLQFLGHCDLECEDCAHEIVLLSFSGEAACPAGIAFRTGIDASKHCTCEQTIALRSARGFCAACKEWGLTSRESPAVAAIGGGLERWWGCRDCKWEAFTTHARSIGMSNQQNAGHRALRSVLRVLGLEQHAKRLIELGHSERELRRMDWGSLSLLARNQLRLTGRSRSKFVAAFTQCHSSQVDHAAAPSRPAAACMASTLSVATADQWQRAIASLREAHIDEAIVVTPLAVEAASPPAHFVALLAEHREAPRLTLRATQRRIETSESVQGSNHAERAANRWLQVTLQLKQSCWEHLEAAERTRGHDFVTLIYLRADSAWLPGTSLPTLLAPIQSLYLRAEACKGVPCLFVPDTENYWSGTNDRFGIMNRAAGAAYFDGWKRLSRRSRKRSTNAERELALTLNQSGVRVRTFPTLSALTCCLSTRKNCWRSQCHSLCHLSDSSAKSQGFKYQFEAHAAALNAYALRSREQCFGKCHADAGVCLRPEARQLTATPADFFWVLGQKHAANDSAWCAALPMEQRGMAPPQQARDQPLVRAAKQKKSLKEKRRWHGTRCTRSHVECGAHSWCDDKGKCRSCSDWDPNDTSASITYGLDSGKLPPACESRWKAAER